MKLAVFAFIILLLYPIATMGQGDFFLKKDVSKEVIRFDNAFNLITVTAEVNGIPAKFILDTGLNRTLLFNLNGIDSLVVNDGSQVEINGLGRDGTITALKSEGNLITMNNVINSNAEILVVVDEQLTLLQKLGKNVNGIIGADFFRSLSVEIDFRKSRLVVRPSGTDLRKWKRWHRQKLKIRQQRPYVTAMTDAINTKIPLTLMIDTGSGDAIWFNKAPDSNIQTFNDSYDDYLGWGLNGDIYGIRTKLNRFYFAGKTLNDVTLAIPDSVSLDYRKTIADGHLGGDFLSRFKIVLDYHENVILFKANSKIDEGFYYNMSGLTIEYGEQEILTLQGDNSSQAVDSYGVTVQGASIESLQINDYRVVKFVHKIIVKEVAEGSPAWNAGIRVGDEIVKFNKKAAYQQTIAELIMQFYRDPNKIIRLKLRRDEKTFKASFPLVPILVE